MGRLRSPAAGPGRFARVLGNARRYGRRDTKVKSRSEGAGVDPVRSDIYLRYHGQMNRRHRRTLRRIFAEPTRADLRWSEIEALLRAVGAEISEGAGSRVRIALGGVRAVFHRPHPGPETRRGLVRAVRDLLAAAGVEPEKE
jgi:hypothetical protein